MLKRTFLEFVENCQRIKLERTKEEYLKARHKQNIQLGFMSLWRKKLSQAKSEYVKMQQTKVELQEHYDRELKALIFVGGFKQYW